MKGCGILPGCPGPTGFHNNHTFHFLRCCNTTKCNAGPGEGARDLAQDLGLGAERCIQAGCSQANPSTLLSPLEKKKKNGPIKPFLKKDFVGIQGDHQSLTKTCALCFYIFLKPSTAHHAGPSHHGLSPRLLR